MSDNTQYYVIGPVGAGKTTALCINSVLKGTIGWDLDDVGFRSDPSAAGSWEIPLGVHHVMADLPDHVTGIYGGCDSYVADHVNIAKQAGARVIALLPDAEKLRSNYLERGRVGDDKHYEQVVEHLKDWSLLIRQLSSSGNPVEIVERPQDVWELILADRGQFITRDVLPGYIPNALQEWRNWKPGEIIKA